MTAILWILAWAFVSALLFITMIVLAGLMDMKFEDSTLGVLPFICMFTPLGLVMVFAYLMIYILASTMDRRNKRTLKIKRMK